MVAAFGVAVAALASVVEGGVATPGEETSLGLLDACEVVLTAGYLTQLHISYLSHDLSRLASTRSPDLEQCTVV